MFWAFAILILVLVAVSLLYPFWTKGSTSIPMGQEAALDQEVIDLKIEKQTLIHSLSELDLDLSQGRLSAEDHKRIRNMEEVQLGKVLDRLESIPAAHSASRQAGEVTPARIGAKGGLTVLFLFGVIGASWIIFTSVEGKIGFEAKKEMASRRAAAPPPQQGMPNPLEMVARLEKRLAENPDDLQGQIMAGRSYTTLNRFDEALTAWRKVIELDFGNHEAHFNAGLLILQTTPRSDIESLKQVIKHFDTALVKVPREPAVLWYRGVALVHLKQYAAADEDWTTAYQNLPAGTEDAEFVRDALQKLRAGNPPLY